MLEVFNSNCLYGFSVGLGVCVVWGVVNALQCRRLLIAWMMDAQIDISSMAKVGLSMSCTVLQSTLVAGRTPSHPALT